LFIFSETSGSSIYDYVGDALPGTINGTPARTELGPIGGTLQLNYPSTAYGDIATAFDTAFTAPFTMAICYKINATLDAGGTGYIMYFNNNGGSSFIGIHSPGPGNAYHGINSALGLQSKTTSLIQAGEWTWVFVYIDPSAGTGTFLDQAFGEQDFTFTAGTITSLANAWFPRRGSGTMPVEYGVIATWDRKLTLAEARGFIYDLPNQYQIATIATGGTVPRNESDRYSDFINVKDYGAKGDGSTDDRAAIQSAYDVAANKIVVFPKSTGSYNISSTILVRDGTVSWGLGGNGQFNTSDTNQPTVRMTGSVTNAIFAPYDTTTAWDNAEFHNLKMLGNGNTEVGIHGYRMNYAKITRNLITNCKRGIIIDAGSSYAAYFNKIEDNKIAYNLVEDITLRNAANVNWIVNNTLIGTPSMISLTNSTTGCVIAENAIQGAVSPISTNGIYVASGSHTISDNWIEALDVGINISSSAQATIRGNHYGGNVTNTVVNASFQMSRSEFEPTATSAASQFIRHDGGLQFVSHWTSTVDQYLWNVVRPVAYQTTNISYMIGYSNNPASLHRFIWANNGAASDYVDHLTGDFVSALAGGKLYLYDTPMRRNSDGVISTWNFGVDTNLTINGASYHIERDPTTGPSGASGYGSFFAGTDNRPYYKNDAGTITPLGTTYNTNIVGLAMGDMTTTITTGNNLAYWIAPYDGTIVGAFGTVFTVSSGGTPTIDIHKNGSTILSTKITIDVGERSSATGTPAVFTSTTFSAGDLFTFDIDVAGTGAVGPQINMAWTRR
jgi:hypothetical protein